MTSIVPLNPSSNDAPHTTSTMNPHFRKIELQSPADLQHLMAQMRIAARQKIDLAFPPQANGSHQTDTNTNGAANGDALRRRVEELVEEYVRNVFQGVRTNSLVNGMELDTRGNGEDIVEEEYEPLDSKLAEKLRQAEADKERLTEQVSDLRRTAPQIAAQNYKESALAEQALLDAEIAAMQADAEAGRLNPAFATDQVQSSNEAHKSLLDGGELPRADEVEKRWAQAMNTLLTLKTQLPETTGKLDRAKGVMDYMDEKSARS